MRPALFTIAPGANFAQALALGLMARLETEAFALSSTIIYLPTRRAARNFGDAFARVLGGATLLPEFRALGESEEDELLFDAGGAGFSLPPAIAPIRRQLLLATLIQRWDQRQRGGTLTFAQANALAGSLAGVLDEIQTQGADWNTLKDLATPALAGHWEEVSQFLALIRDAWPPLLAAEGRSDPAARRNQALELLCRRLTEQPPHGMVIAAGSTGSIPATAALLKTIAGLPKGAVVLPGLDRALEERSWNGLDDEPGHPQFGMKKLLDAMGTPRDAVADWYSAGGHGAAPAQSRILLLREALRPAPATDAWHILAQTGAASIAPGLGGMALVAAADPAEEALVIALALRESLESPGTRAALVTPDRSLARRVAGALSRWGIAIDDSAGRPLAHTSAGIFLLLLAQAAEAEFAPVPLLALLKHPFATLGEDSARFRAFARQLDRLCLRGPRPDPGLDGITRAIARTITRTSADPHTGEDLAPLAAWWARVRAVLAPLQDAFTAKEMALEELIACHGAAAEQMACGKSHEDAQGCPLWRGPDGEAAAELIAELVQSVPGLPALAPHYYPALLAGLMRKKAVRPRFTRHRAIAILGPLEARLQHFDLTILGGLNEGTWPAAPPADPWFSRPMRARLGLEQPERAIGLAAHDFAMLAAGPRVLFTRARKDQGAPTIASRWLQRLEQLVEGLGLALAPSAHLEWARRLAEVTPVPPAPRPAPKPPLAARPRQLSVTEIETWLRDPYAIYARHVLKLKPLKALDEAVGPLERGTILHKALEEFVRRYPKALPDDAALKLAALADEIFAAQGIPKAALALWRPRFLSAAQWFVGFEKERRLTHARSWLEEKGRMAIGAPGGIFTLTGRADRIDLLANGDAAIMDYKTGLLPSLKQVNSLLSPQLPLEGAMLAAGGFGAIGKRKAQELIYLGIWGGTEPGKQFLLPDVDDLIARAHARLAAQIARYDDENCGYLAQAIPRDSEFGGDYDHLARAREWSAAGDDAP